MPSRHENEHLDTKNQPSQFYSNAKRVWVWVQSISLKCSDITTKPKSNKQESIPDPKTTYPESQNLKKHID